MVGAEGRFVFLYLYLYLYLYFCNLLSNMWTQHRVDGLIGAEGRFVDNSAHHSRRMAGAPEGGTGETWRESCFVLRDLQSFEALSLEARCVMET